MLIIVNIVGSVDIVDYVSIVDCVHIVEKCDIVTDFIGIRSWHDKSLNHTGEKPPPRSGGKPPGPSRLLRTSTTPPLWPCHPRGERQVGALGVLARWLRSLQMVPGLKY